MNTIGSNLLKLRHSKKLSQEALAAALGVHQTYIAAIEKGRKTPSLPFASKISSFFGVTLNDLTSPTEATPCQN